MRQTILTSLCAITLMVTGAFGQGTADGLELSSAVNAGAFDASNKTVVGTDILSVRMVDNGAGVVGNVLALAGDLVPCNFPICIDLDGNPLTCELELGQNLFFIIDPTTSSFPPTLPSLGLQLALTIPANLAAFLSAEDEALRLQGAVANIASPIGVSISNIVEAYVGGAVLAGPTSDDGAVEITLENGAPFYGAVYTSMWVNANGNITFGSADSDWNSTEAEFLADQPRIAPAWTDISPNIDGEISVTLVRSCGGNLESVTVDYVAIPNFNAGAGNNLHTFTATLYGTGDIDLAWPMLDSNGDDLVAGISPGGGISGANQVNLAGGGFIAGGANLAMYQVLTGLCGSEAALLEGGMGTFTYDGVSAYDYNGIAGTPPAFQATSVTPNQGFDTGGTAVTINGNFFNLLGTYTVEFGAGNFTPAVVVDACTLSAITPPGVVGTVDVIVTDLSLASSTIVGGFTYQPAGVASGTFSLTDDSSVQYVLSIAPTTINFYGPRTDFHVNANGNLTFGGANGTFTETPALMLSALPRIAPHWDDMNPSSGGTVSFFEDATSVTITYTNVPAYTTGSNTSATTIDKLTGEISITYGASNTSWNGVVALRSVIVGISAGGGLGVNTPIDPNVPGSTPAGAPNGALFSHLNTSGNPAWGLDGQTIRFTPDLLGTTYTFSNP